MRIKYIPFFAENMEEQVRFFTEKLKFKVLEKVGLYENATCKLLHSENEDVLIAVSENKYNGGYKNSMILSTDDCIKDYHQLMAEGLSFTKPPHYLPIGMVAEFTDQYNNRYTLLEERNYNDDL